MKKRYYIPKKYSYSLSLDKKTIFTSEELVNLPPQKFAEVVSKLGVEYTLVKFKPTKKYGDTGIEEVYRAQQGDEKIRNKIITDNTGMLVSILQSLLPTIGVRRESDTWKEFIQLGRIALDRAIDTFREDKGAAAFSTWAFIIVRNEYISYWKQLVKDKERYVSLSTPVREEETLEGQGDRSKALEEILADPKEFLNDLELASALEEIKRKLSPVALEIFMGRLENTSLRDLAVILKDKGFKTIRDTDYTIQNISEILYNSVKPVLEKVFGISITSAVLFAGIEWDLAGIDRLIFKIRNQIFESLKEGK